MKTQFQDLAIDCWRHTGARLGRAEECICVQAGAEARGILLLAVDELIAESPPAKRLLTLQPSDRRATTKCSAIRLRLSPESEDLRQMSLTSADGVAVWEFTPLGIRDFREAVVFWRNGGEDFSIGPRARNRKRDLGAKDLASGEVWFWTPNMEP